MDTCLERRVGVSDVIQETYLEALRRIDEYISQPQLTFYVWLRFLAIQQVKTSYRRHVEAQARDLRREVGIRGEPDSSQETGSVCPASPVETPSQIFIRGEKGDLLRGAMDGLEPLDREVILLRHFEHLSWTEVGEILGLHEPATRQRHCRAMKKLKEILRASSPEGSAFWR